MTQTEVLKLALEALEFFKELSLSIKEIERAKEAITAIKEALAQPAVTESHKQEPSLAIAAQKVLDEFGTSSEGLQELYQALKLYTNPPQRKPLFKNVHSVSRYGDMSVTLVFRSCASASEFIEEAKLRELNEGKE